MGISSRTMWRGVIVAAALFVLTPVEVWSQTSVSGEVRIRREAERDRVGPGSEFFTRLRTRIGLRTPSMRDAGANVQFQDARVFGEETSTLTDGSADQIDVHQAYGWVAGEVGDKRIRVTAGRQELILDNERLIGAVGWSNTGRSFDALRAELTPSSDAWEGAAFVATVSERGVYGPAPAPGGDHTLIGVSVERDGLFVLLTHDFNATYRGMTDVDRSTLSARWSGGVGSVASLGLEGAFQFGDHTPLLAREEISAWFVGVRVGAEELGPLGAPELGIDWLSGDSDPTDGSYGAFNTLYATNHKWYGLMDLFLDPAARTGDRGLIDALAGGTVRLGEVPVRTTLHRFWFAESSASGRPIGWELDTTATIALPDGAALLVGYGGFLAGGAAPVAGLGPDGDARHWAFAQLTIRF